MHENKTFKEKGLTFSRPRLYKIAEPDNPLMIGGDKNKTQDIDKAIANYKLALDSYKAIKKPTIATRDAIRKTEGIVTSLLQEQKELPLRKNKRQLKLSLNLKNNPYHEKCNGQVGVSNN